MTAAKRYLPSYTVADYCQWEGDWELWEGVPVAMSPSPFGRHSAISSRLISQLDQAIELAGGNAEVLNEIDWIVSEDTVVRPDVLVVCDGVPQRHVETAPTLIAEVLSEATRVRDRTIKRNLYQSEGVDHYLILDPDSNEMVWSRLIGDQWKDEQITDPFDLTLCDDCKIRLTPSKLFR